MADRFAYNVFLSYSSLDKPRVLRLAEELRDAGLRVWFDGGLSSPGDSFTCPSNAILLTLRVETSKC
jgi:hypothetical protein